MDIMFGLDFSLSRFFSRNRTVSTTDPNFFHYIAMGLLSLENSFMYLEVGYTQVEKKVLNKFEKDYQGIGIRSGLHFFF